MLAAVRSAALHVFTLHSMSKVIIINSATNTIKLQQCNAKLFVIARLRIRLWLVLAITVDLSIITNDSDTT